VPTRLRRLGLSQVINHLLGRTDDPVPFDFLISNKFLRTSLQKYLLSDKSEDTLEIEYVLALAQPETKADLEHPDWVSAVDQHQNTSSHHLIISGSYDSIVRFWKKSEKLNTTEDKPVLTLTGHTAPIKAIATSTNTPGIGADNIMVVSASQDHMLKLWQVSMSKLKSSFLNTFAGHVGSVECCDIDETGNLIASGGWDHTIKLWKIHNDQGQDETSETEVIGAKRRKIMVDPSLKKATSSMNGHTQPVTSLKFKANEIITGSWDNTVKFWDVESGVNTSTLNGTKVVNSIAYSLALSSVLTAHSDHVIRLWDTRSDNEICRSFNSHRGWVSSVAFHPSRPELFVSGSYDNTVKLWDIRSETPLHTMDKHTEKVLTVGWFSNTVMLSGSADKMLSIHQLQK